MFGKSNRRGAQHPAYDYRPFETNDARQYAFDDLHVIPTQQSGLCGLVPLWNAVAVEPPNGFDYFTNLIGYGGTISPASANKAQPLVNQPNWAKTFLQENAGYTGADYNF